MTRDDIPELPDDTESIDDIPELPLDAMSVEDLPELPDEVEPAAPPKAKPIPAPVERPTPKPTPVKAAPVKRAPVTQQAPAPKPAVQPVAKPVVKQPVVVPKAPVPPVAAQVDEAPVPEAAVEPVAAAAGEAALEALAVPSEAPTAAVELAPGEKPPLRELDKAPAHLRKAALIVCAGCLLPFMGGGGGWMSAIAAKLLVLIGAWLWFVQVMHNWGPPRKDALGKLAELAFTKKKKEDDEKKKRRTRDATATALEHPFPTALHLLSLVVTLAACIGLPLLDKAPDANAGILIAELGMLAWAAFTRVHIDSYERWGKFNPIFPLMFLGMVFGGAARVIFGFSGEELDLFSVLGGAIVAAGGTLAAYTIVEALMQAKKEGDLKKQEALEARRAARKTRKGAKTT